MKFLIIILGFFNGCYMLLDGVYVISNGKYIGSLKPGPWAIIFNRLNVDIYKLGPLFILFGVLWLIWLYGFWESQSWAYIYGVVLCVLTMWYLPVGTMFSLIILIILLFARQKLGI